MPIKIPDFDNIEIRNNDKNTILIINTHPNEYELVILPNETAKRFFPALVDAMTDWLEKMKNAN